LPADGISAAAEIIGEYGTVGTSSWQLAREVTSLLPCRKARSWPARWHTVHSATWRFEFYPNAAKRIRRN